VGAELCETREVFGGSQEREILGHAYAASRARTAPAVSATHQMPKLAFDFGARGFVVLLPGGVFLPPSLARDQPLMEMNVDVSPRF
jgi:hypothetical protein